MNYYNISDIFVTVRKGLKIALKRHQLDKRRETISFLICFQHIM
jgi:hypothetical protein